MKFSEQWLRSWVDPAISVEAMCDQLTMAGLEVDGVEPAAAAFRGVVVARVVSMEKHPDADKLNVCQVDNGDEVLQIVCGAANVRPGLNVPLAMIGAELPAADGGVFRIKAAKLRGVASSGMLCSEKELGLAEQADGLMELPDDAPPGVSLREYLQLDDNVVEIDLTPNRGDCLSIAGIARELAVLNRCEVSQPAMPAVAAQIEAGFPVEIEAGEICTRYVGRVIKGIDARARTPVWMLERLRRSGIRGLNPVVDVTNYVMLELGQPMHAFDLDRLKTKITVRLAAKGESITLLDGKPIELDEATLVIADDDGPLAIAGVMGGEASGVGEDTVDIFLESAFFKPEIIAGKARSYGLHTDSSHRFERGVDTGLQAQAIERATALILDICGGQAAAVQEVTTEAHPRQKPAIMLRRQRIGRVLGIELDDDEVVSILGRLGLGVSAVEGGWQVEVPSYRFDLNIEADLLEELVRIHGYNNIPRIHSDYPGVIRPQPEARQSLVGLKRRLVCRGYHEAITYSFVDPAMQSLLDPDVEPVALANPISSEMSVMRTSLWPGLLQALKYNLNRQQARVRLFESGQCFRPAGDRQQDSLQAGLSQQPMFGAVVCGEVFPGQWGQAGRKVDFFDLKADLESLLPEGVAMRFEAATHPALHPGQCARIQHDGQTVGWLGALHPSLQKTLGLEQAVYLFEIELAALETRALPAFTPLSRFPETRRDIAVIVDESVSAGEMLAAIRENASKLLVESEIFDIYDGQGVEKGAKSVAFGLILQEFSRTLTDEEIDAEIENIVSVLKQRFAATLRE